MPLGTLNVPINDRLDCCTNGCVVGFPDELVTVASGLAGGASFAEVLDLASLRNLSDPLRQEITAILRGHGQEL